MKVLYVYDKGSNIRYLHNMLELQNKMFKDFSYIFVRLPEYITFDQNNFDLLIYQTFPDPSHPTKFTPELAKQGDEKFWEFKGIKVLQDSYDNGELDAFSRMGETAEKLPRIKSTPGFSYLKKFNVIYDIPPWVGSGIARNINRERDILVHCAFAVKDYYGHRIRHRIMDILHNEFSKEVDFIKVNSRKYLRHLERTQISITAPGFGPCSNTFWYALRTATLSVAEQTVDRYKLLPRVDLIPDEDYVSFSVDTLADKLRYLLKNPDECERIRRSGYKKFMEGYNFERSTKDFHTVLENLCN